MKVLVTGASGMLGGATALGLAARGDQVTVLQRHRSGLGLNEMLGDVADPGAVRAAVTGQDAVIHLAAKVGVAGPESVYRRVNVEGTRTLIQACRDAGTTRLVHVSSPSVAHAGRSLIGAGAGLADPGRARGPYARTKAEAERIALDADTPDLAVVAIRPHLVWGPGDPQLVARIVARGAAGRLPLIGSGAVLVDTTYLDNAVDAMVAALDRAPEAHGQALVITNGEPRPIRDILQSICDAAGVPGPRHRVPARLAIGVGGVVERVWSLRGRNEEDPPITAFLAEQLSTAHWFDQRRTREVLQWAPRVSLDEGFSRLAQSFIS